MKLQLFQYSIRGKRVSILLIVIIKMVDNKSKEIDIKNRTYFGIDDLININDLGLKILY